MIITIKPEQKGTLTMPESREGQQHLLNSLMVQPEPRFGGVKARPFRFDPVSVITWIAVAAITVWFWAVFAPGLLKLAGI